MRFWTQTTTCRLEAKSHDSARPFAHDLPGVGTARRVCGQGMQPGTVGEGRMQQRAPCTCRGPAVGRKIIITRLKLVGSKGTVLDVVCLKLCSVRQFYMLRETRYSVTFALYCGVAYAVAYFVYNAIQATLTPYKVYLFRCFITSSSKEVDANMTART